MQQAKLALAIIIGNNKLNQSFKSTSKSSPVVVAHEVSSKRGAAQKNTNPEEEEDEGSFKQVRARCFLSQSFCSFLLSNGNVLHRPILHIIY